MQPHLYLAHQMSLEVGNVGLQPLATVTPGEIHDGEFPSLPSVPRPQSQAHRSILHTGGTQTFKFLAQLNTN